MTRQDDQLRQPIHQLHGTEQETPSETPVRASIRVKDVVSVAVACVALTGFGVFVLALLFQLKLNEVSWTRAVYLLNGIEAIAFAATGYLFGREVNRGRAENAEDLAKGEQKRADQSEQRGQHLADAIRGAADRPSSRRTVLETLDTPSQRLEVLTELADGLFPPRKPEGRS